MQTLIAFFFRIFLGFFRPLKIQIYTIFFVILKETQLAQSDVLVLLVRSKNNHKLLNFVCKRKFLSQMMFTSRYLKD